MSVTKPTFKEALKFWVKLGFISFGGPAGQVAIMHQYLVEEKKWISNSRFLHALNYCMLLPGPEAQQLATYTGWLLHGIRGGLAAGLLFILPSAIMLWALSAAYVSYGNLPLVQTIFSALKPAVVAIVLMALMKIGKKSLSGWLHYIVAAAAFVAIFFLHIAFPVIIASAVAIAVLLQFTKPELLQQQQQKQNAGEVDEREFFINRHSVESISTFSVLKLLKQVSLFVLLWAIPLLLFYCATSSFDFWKTLSIFFTKAALVTFGGAYAVLPYVAQVSVEKLKWLSAAQMLDGLALGETTPGPLIIILAFVGFMAGYNHFSSSLLGGTVGLITTAFYTFLPCFFFIFAGAPLIERTRENGFVKNILGLITAAVVGVVLNLTIYLAKAVMLPNEISVSEINFAAVAWAAVSFIAMYRFNVGMIKWIGVSVIAGLILYLNATI